MKGACQAPIDSAEGVHWSNCGSVNSTDTRSYECDWEMTDSNFPRMSDHLMLCHLAIQTLILCRGAFLYSYIINTSTSWLKFWAMGVAMTQQEGEEHNTSKTKQLDPISFSKIFLQRWKDSWGVVNADDSPSGFVSPPQEECLKWEDLGVWQRP